MVGRYRHGSPLYKRPVVKPPSIDVDAPLTRRAMRGIFGVPYNVGGPKLGGSMRWMALVSVGLSAWLVACGGEKEKDKKPPVAENQAPTAKITAPKLARTGQKITIDASKSTDPEAGKLKFLWLEGEKNPANNFLDGLDLTDAKLTFTPDVEGKFSYTVEIKDSEGLEDSATVTIEVSDDYVPPDLEAPTITAVVINGITYSFGSTPSPVVFTNATGVLTVSALGTDPEDDAAGTDLTTVYSANVSGAVTASGKEYWVASQYNAAEDDDPFATLSFSVQVQDSDGLKSAAKTVEVRVVPKATAQLAPKAAFVDCSAIADGTGLEMTSPRNALDSGYQTAMGNGLSDVFVAAGGTACKGAQVDFHSIRLWGLFDPADTWRRLTDPIDKALNRVGAGERRYALRTTIADPTAYRLIYSSGSTYSTGHINIDGFSFEMSGWNYYAVSLTVGVTNDTVDIGLFNNEFVGNVTSAASLVAGLWVPGAVLVQRNTSTASNGGTYMLRNLFAVASTGSTSVMQAWVDGSNRLKDAGTVHFYANVFTGTIKNSPVYRCNNYSVAAARVGFAFCFHQYAGFANVGRNTLWANTVTNTVNPIVVSAGNGKLLGYGNLFNTKNNPYTIRLTQNSDDAIATGAKDGIHFYSAFPTDSTAVYVYLLTRSNGNAATPSAFPCLLSGSFAASPCSSADARLYSVGSYNYNLNTLVHDTAQGWRTYSTTGVDTFVPSDLGSSWNALAAWDFDGYYGPKDNGTGNGAKFNAGAFETLP